MAVMKFIAFGFAEKISIFFAERKAINFHNLHNFVAS